jgi:hypothetical protein
VTESFDNLDDALEQQRVEREQAEAEARVHTLSKIIDLGFAVQQFIDGELGRRLEKDARLERIELTERYVMLDPDDPAELKEMRTIRFRINVLNAWQEFFATYIRNGEAARQQLGETEQTD